MQTLVPFLRKFLVVISLLFIGNESWSQNSNPPVFNLTDFAVWGGSASPTNYQSAQAVTINNNIKITGNIGSNHLVSVKNDFKLTGSIVSFNGIIANNNAAVNGNIFAVKSAANYTGNVVSVNNGAKIVGNLSANGKVVFKNNNSIAGKVFVPAPTNSNYSGPSPSAGFSNTLSFPVPPAMPNNTPFDNKVGTETVSNTRVLIPGMYKKLALTGNKTITFDGPGTYIFQEVDNQSSVNKFVFDLKGTNNGTISIFVIKDARWGKISVKMANGDFPDRVVTEIHGNGSTFAGFAFDLQGPDVMPSGSYAWLGNVWVPNGGISVKNFKVPANGTPHIIGALWSGKRVNIEDNLVLQYKAPAGGPGFIDPYYNPPATGKVDPVNDKIGAELSSLILNPNPIVNTPNNNVFQFNDAGEVLIEVVSINPNDNTLKGQLISQGMKNQFGAAGTIDNGPHIYTISGYFPINQINSLKTNPLVKFAYPLYPPINNAGQVTTQGDITMRSNNVRDRFGVDGTGVKVGVMSDSYNAKLVAQNDVDQGDLPGIKSSNPPNENPEPVQVLTDLTKGNDEGRAMLQIVHDVAPKAKLAFRTGFLTAGDFAKGIKELASANLPGGPADVIVDDITYITEPFLQDGVVAQTVNEVVGNGVTYFSSAGNFGKKSYEGVFNGVTNTTLIASPGKVHQFGSNATDIFQTLNLKPGSYTIVLQWSDEFYSLGNPTGVQSDLDLYLVGSNGFTLFGFNRSNLNGDPFEVCPFVVKEETTAKVMIANASGTSGVRFKYIIFRGDAVIQDYNNIGNSTIVGHPNAEGAIAVGAMLYENFPAFTPVWPGVASFSSRGGTLTKGNGGTQTRNKPEIIAPNGVNTTVNLGGAVFDDGDSYPNFFGTSAAAPHAAGVAALLIQGQKKFNQLTSVSPDLIRQQLISSAGKFSYLPGNFSFEGGYGYLQADSAIAQIANARPIISSLEPVVPGAQNGNQPFQVKITGKYLTGTTAIYVNGTAVSTTVSPDLTEAVATVPDIPDGQDPSFQLFNSAKSPSEEDGGLSESLFFFSSRKSVLVKAKDASRQFGESNPSFEADVFVDGQPIASTNISLASLKLDAGNLVFNTTATPTSNAGLYGIFPERQLANDDPLLTEYNFTFVSGTLTVGKMKVKITPQNKSLAYGQDPGEITYTYELEAAPGVSAALADQVKALHKQYVSSNSLVVLKDFNDGSNGVSVDDLNNISVMASFQAVKNARKYLSVDGKLVPSLAPVDVTQINSQRFLVDASTLSLQNFLINGASSTMIEPFSGITPRAFLNIKPLSAGTAESAVPNGQLKPIVNGQLLAMVNEQTTPILNGQLVAMVNGQLKPLVNGELLALINGQLMVLVNGEYELATDLTLSNGQLKAIVNGQLKPIVNGQLKAMVNGLIEDIPTTQVSIVNGEVQIIGNNNQVLSVVNGQLMVYVNGQLKPLVNGEGVGVEKVVLQNGQLKAIVNSASLPVTNGQLQAMVNGQLLAMVNGQLVAIVNTNEVTFAVFQQDEVKIVANGQLQPLVNGQLKAIVNSQFISFDNYTITNGQLKAIVNNEEWVYANGQLLAVVNGQLKPLVNNFDVSGPNNNAKTAVLVDQDDIIQQSGDIGAMFSVNMITGLGVGTHYLVPGSFVNENFEVTYGVGQVFISPADLTIKANDATKVYGEENPALSATYTGFVFGDDINSIVPAFVFTQARNTTSVGVYPIIFSGGIAPNYNMIFQAGNLTITKKSLVVRADDKTKLAGEPNPVYTFTYEGLAAHDKPSYVCLPYVVPPSPKVVDQLERQTTYTDVKINNTTNIYNASPGESLTLTGSWNEAFYNYPQYTPYCPGCVTQNYIGMNNAAGQGVIFTDCYDVSGLSSFSGTISKTFNAPTEPGVYYITQVASWQYACYDGGSGNPLNNVEDAIAVVVVNVPGGTITANSATDEATTQGSYPIVVTGCDQYSPNYDVTLQNGTLTIEALFGARVMGKSGANTSVENKAGENGPARYHLYPNPASSTIRLQIKGDEQNSSSIEVYDLVGKLYTPGIQRINSGMFELNISSLAKGIYLIKVKNAAGVKTFRFVKI